MKRIFWLLGIVVSVLYCNIAIYVSANLLYGPHNTTIFSGNATYSFLGDIDHDGTMEIAKTVFPEGIDCFNDVFPPEYNLITTFSQTIAPLDAGKTIFYCGAQVYSIGDIDGDGIEEIIYHIEHPHSTWTRDDIYTYKKDKRKLLLSYDRKRDDSPNPVENIISIKDRLLKMNIITDTVDGYEYRTYSYRYNTNTDSLDYVLNPYEQKIVHTIIRKLHQFIQNNPNTTNISKVRNFLQLLKEEKKYNLSLGGILDAVLRGL